MTLSKDRIIQIILAIVIIVLVGVVFANSSTNQSEENLTDEKVATEEKAPKKEEDFCKDFAGFGKFKEDATCCQKCPIKSQCKTASDEPAKKSTKNLEKDLRDAVK